jgi:hypothetical protein
LGDGHGVESRLPGRLTPFTLRDVAYLDARRVSTYRQRITIVCL